MVEHTYRILLVDDDAASLNVLGEVLNRDGYEIFPAVNGYEAFKIIQEDSIDLTILDYDLPDTTGLELLQEIKPKHPGMPVIIMSGNPSQNIRFDAFEAGAYTFIPKPIDLRQFRQFVAHALDFKQQWPSRSQTSSHTIQVRKSILFRWIRRVK
jgi:DNA-binding NtrC family response regulator